MPRDMEYKGLEIRWLNHHSAFLIKTPQGRTIVTDPWEVSDVEADIILVSHSHYDHLDPDSVRRIKEAGTAIVGTSDCKENISGHFHPLAPGKSVNIDGIVIEGVPAYNTARGRLKFHPRAKKWIGFVLNIDGVKVYHAGDTDMTEEMKRLKEIDIAILPAGGTYTMDGAEAAKAANIIEPKIAIPMHWGKIVGGRRDAEIFEEQFKGETRILE